VPSIAAVTPAQGGAGQQVVITGANLFSPDGQVLARFGDEAAPTACASQTTCTATVPPGSGRVAVTVATQAGTSNAVWFTYQEP